MAMNPTPNQLADAAKKIDRKRLLKDEQLYNQGVQEGRSLARKEVIDWLQKKYMGPGRPDTDTPEAKAILQLTRELSLFLKPRR